MQKIKVKAAQGLKVPYHDKPREYITADKAVEVDAHAYYLRLIAAEELIRTDGAKTPAKKEAE